MGKGTSELTLAGPSAHRPFAGRGRDRFGGGIAQGQKHVPGSLWLILGKVRHGQTQGLETKIGFARGPIDAIEESSQIDQLGAILHEIKIEHLLACHKLKFCSAEFNHPARRFNFSFQAIHM